MNRQAPLEERIASPGVLGQATPQFFQHVHCLPQCCEYTVLVSCFATNLNNARRSHGQGGT
eukprot:5992069-Amphidinium_carterae.1